MLLAHLTLFAYVYPSEARTRARRGSSRHSTARSHGPAPTTGSAAAPCISRAQYLVDVEEWGYADARLPPYGTMSDRDWLNVDERDRREAIARPRRTAASTPRRLPVPEPAEVLS